MGRQPNDDQSEDGKWLADARRELLKEPGILEAIRKIVDQAPPLNDAQLDLLRRSGLTPSQQATRWQPFYEAERVPDSDERNDSG